MKILNIENPFDAPIYHEETLSSTFDAAHALAEKGLPHGTVVCADFQEAGKGRLKPGAKQSRPWIAERGKNLLFTILLRYGDFSSIPKALTLRTGLAVSLAIEELIPSLKGHVQIKWPNDVMLNFRKVAGILTEGDGNTIFIGVGVNVTQKDFSTELSTGNQEYRPKAASLIHLHSDLAENARFILLEKILLQLYKEIEKPQEKNQGSLGSLLESWQERLLKRLYKKGETVIFSEGYSESAPLVEGTLSGIGSGGELLIIPKGEETERAFVTGELRVY